MSEIETLQFENARALSGLFAHDLQLIKLLEKEVGVRATTRDGWIRFEGEREAVDAACKVMKQLEAAQKLGINIQKSEFKYTLRTVLDPAQDTTENVGEGAVQDDLSGLYQSRVVFARTRQAVMPKTGTQRKYMDLIKNNDVVFGVGPAGTGKTYMAVAMAVAALKQEETNRIILTRPAVEAGEALGFLPGDLHEKIYPYLRPLYDALQDMLPPDEIQKYMEKGVIEIAPLAYMRGRTLNHAFIILDEAQNTTREQMFMFLTRLGAESKCVITGDRTQIDLPVSKQSGLLEAIQALENVPGIGFLHFAEKDVIRHELVQTIIKAYNNHRQHKEKGDLKEQSPDTLSPSATTKTRRSLK